MVMGKRRKHKIRQLKDKNPWLDSEDPNDDFMKSWESLDLADFDFIAKQKETPPPDLQQKKPSKGTFRSVDLHGLSLAAAKDRIDWVIRSHRAQSSEPLKLRIITGKGHHSGPLGGVLVREIHGYVAITYRNSIVSMDESPARSCVNGIPLRGYFTVIIRS